MSLLYVYNVRENQAFAVFLNPTYTLYIIIGVEVIVSVLYYIGEEGYALFEEGGREREIEGREEGRKKAVSMPFFHTSVQALWFNYMKQPPDVIQETNSVSNSPTNTLTTVGFRSVRIHV